MSREDRVATLKNSLNPWIPDDDPTERKMTYIIRLLEALVDERLIQIWDEAEAERKAE